MRLCTPSSVTKQNRGVLLPIQEMQEALGTRGEPFQNPLGIFISWAVHAARFADRVRDSQKRNGGPVGYWSPAGAPRESLRFFRSDLFGD